jgi:hypothetical protein
VNLCEHDSEAMRCIFLPLYPPQLRELGIPPGLRIIAVRLDASGLHLTLPTGIMTWETRDTDWSEVWPHGPGVVFEGGAALRELWRIARDCKLKRRPGQRGKGAGFAERDAMLAEVIEVMHCDAVVIASAVRKTLTNRVDRGWHEPDRPIDLAMAKYAQRELHNANRITLARA